MSHARTALVQSLAVTGCHIDLTNQRQNFACPELVRLLGKKKWEELKNNMRNQAKRNENKNMWRNKGGNSVICLFSQHKCVQHSTKGCPTNSLGVKLLRQEASMRVVCGVWPPHTQHALQPAATGSSNRSYEDLMESVFSQTLKDL
jgi:hypothetical protein